MRVCRCARVCVLEPHISAFFVFCSACCCCLQLRTLTTMRVCVDHCYTCLVMRYACMPCVCSVYVQSRYNNNRTASLCGPPLCVCDVCGMLGKHVTYATTFTCTTYCWKSTPMFKVKNSTQQDCCTSTIYTKNRFKVNNSYRQDRSSC